MKDFLNMMAALLMAVISVLGYIGAVWIMMWIMSIVSEIGWIRVLIMDF